MNDEEKKDVDFSVGNQIVRQLNPNFFRTFMGQWARNSRDALLEIAAGLRMQPIAALKGWNKNETAVVVGSGPTLDLNYHGIELVKDRVDVIATANTLPFLLEHGIRPRYCLVADTNPILATRVFNWLSDEQRASIQFIIPTTAPAIWRTVIDGSNLFYFKPFVQEYAGMPLQYNLLNVFIDALFQDVSSYLVVPGSSGNAAIAFAAGYLEYKEVLLLGMDSRFFEAGGGKVEVRVRAPGIQAAIDRRDDFITMFGKITDTAQAMYAWNMLILDYNYDVPLVHVGRNSLLEGLMPSVPSTAVEEMLGKMKSLKLDEDQRMTMGQKFSDEWYTAIGRLAEEQAKARAEENPVEGVTE